MYSVTEAETLLLSKFDIYSCFTPTQAHTGVYVHEIILFFPLFDLPRLSDHFPPAICDLYVNISAQE